MLSKFGFTFACVSLAVSAVNAALFVVAVVGVVPAVAGLVAAGYYAVARRQDRE